MIDLCVTMKLGTTAWGPHVHFDIGCFDFGWFCAQGVEKRARSMPLPGARPAPLFPEPAAAADAGAPRAKSAPDASVPSASSASPASREPGSSQGSPFTSSGPMRHSGTPPFAQARMLADKQAVKSCSLEQQFIRILAPIPGMAFKQHAKAANHAGS